MNRSRTPSISSPKHFLLRLVASISLSCFDLDFFLPAALLHLLSHLLCNIYRIIDYMISIKLIYPSYTDHYMYVQANRQSKCLDYKWLSERVVHTPSIIGPTTKGLWLTLNGKCAGHVITQPYPIAELGSGTEAVQVFGMRRAIGRCAKSDRESASPYQTDFTNFFVSAATISNVTNTNIKPAHCEALPIEGDVYEVLSRFVKDSQMSTGHSYQSDYLFAGVQRCP